MKIAEVHVEELHEWASAAVADQDDPTVEVHVLATRWELRCGDMEPLRIDPER